MMPTLTDPAIHRPIVPRADLAGVAFVTAPSPVGLVLVAHEAGSPALLAVLIGDDEDTLRAELQRRFPRAHLMRDAGAIASGLAKDVIRMIDSPAHTRAPRLDPRGTAFQQRVWSALREIPAGQTTSYAELARRLGTPKAARAVAGACAANPLAIVVPCHRVVRGDGTLSGYRWGVERKRELLRREGVLA